MRERFPDIERTDSAANALANSSAALIVTEWGGFAALDEEFKAIARKLVVDGRRINFLIDERDLEYEGLCW